VRDKTEDQTSSLGLATEDLVQLAEEDKDESCQQGPSCGGPQRQNLVVPESLNAISVFSLQFLPSSRIVWRVSETVRL